MDIYVRDKDKLKGQDPISVIGNDVELYLRTLDETTVRDLTISCSLSKMPTILLDNTRLVNLFIVAPSSAVRKSGRNYSRSETEQQ